MVMVVGLLLLVVMMVVACTLMIGGGGEVDGSGGGSREENAAQRLRYHRAPIRGAPTRRTAALSPTLHLTRARSLQLARSLVTTS